MRRGSLPPLPRFAWAWTRAFVVGLAVCSATSAVLSGLQSSSAAGAFSGGLYPLFIAAIFAIPTFLVIWLSPPLHRGLAIPAGALCCAVPQIIPTALSGPLESSLPELRWRLGWIAIYGLAGGMGGLAFYTFNVEGRPKRIAKALLFASVALTLLPISAWWMAWRVPPVRPGSDANWETAASGECPLMARAIHEMKFDHFADQPPLMSDNKAGGPCDWRALGMPFQRVTWKEFRDAAGPALTGRYIEHIAVSRPRYSLLHLRATVEVSHSYGPLGGDGFYCSFSRGLSGWQFMSCTRAWIS